MSLNELVTCNCSICSKMGWIVGFVPSDQFQLQRGEDALSDYQFHKKSVHHLFCSTCGVRSFAKGTGPDGSEMVCVNVRCLDGVDATTLKTMAYDGANM